MPRRRRANDSITEPWPESAISPRHEVDFGDSFESGNMDDISRPETLQTPETSHDEVPVGSGVKAQLEKIWREVELIFKGTKWSFGDEQAASWRETGDGGDDDKIESGYGYESDDEYLSQKSELNVEQLIEKLLILRSLTDSIKEKGAPNRNSNRRTTRKKARWDLTPKDLLQRLIDGRKRNKRSELTGRARIAVATQQMNLIEDDMWHFKVGRELKAMAEAFDVYKNNKPSTRRIAECRVAKELIKGLTGEKKKQAAELIKTQVEKQFEPWWKDQETGLMTGRFSAHIRRRKSENSQSKEGSPQSDEQRSQSTERVPEIRGMKRKATAQ
ncbi:hypothetical protein HYFRA_00005612 [Hymenoscyphus fraxineus]|uniref:Uncharacterized protein n=1 Tax=Hymenoscyphus fraxineus TaxID=746836 RepID=A0A9N9KSD3_9HELO|nr:hypothetical protein HYFRA_00005612 [Hymenoscyphus fraxineus]